MNAVSRACAAWRGTTTHSVTGKESSDGIASSLGDGERVKGEGE